MPVPDVNPWSKYGVVCDSCGPQGLTEENYNQQMSRPDNSWVCPNCSNVAWWDDERYENSFEPDED